MHLVDNAVMEYVLSANDTCYETYAVLSPSMSVIPIEAEDQEIQRCINKASFTLVGKSRMINEVYSRDRSEMTVVRISDNTLEVYYPYKLETQKEYT